MRRTVSSVQPELYDRDFCTWADVMARCLRNKNVEALDWHNLAEEIEALAKQERRELFNRIEVLITHLLKWQFQKDRRCGSWRGSIIEQRKRIDALIKDSPSLGPLVPQAIAERYPDAVEIAVAEMELDENPCPHSCPFPQHLLFKKDYYPE